MEWDFMANKKQPSQPKSTEEILREMEAMAQDDNDSDSSAGKPGETDSSGGTLKSLLGFFVKVVPEDSEASKPNPPALNPPQRQAGPRVGDLVAGEAAPKFSAPSTTADDLSQKAFAEIYREAGIANSPCDVDELAALMENPTVANQPLSVKVIAVNLTLSAKGIGHDVPIADAVRRDRALDAYQSMLVNRARSVEQRNLEKIQQLTQETEEYLKRKQIEMDALRTEISEANRHSLEFSLRRETEEKRLASLITPFLEGTANPVTIGNPLGSIPGSGETVPKIKA
jgi:hypothetical protein